MDNAPTLAGSADRPTLRIAVTGGAGMIGQYVIHELLDHGHTPVCIDLRAPESLGRPKPYEVKVADLTDLGEVYGALRDVDAVIHLAAIPWAGRYSPEVTFHTNIMGHFNMLEACVGLRIAKVATASSIQAAVPMRSQAPKPPRYFPVDEDEPPAPDTEYGLSKEAGEAANRMYHRRYGLQAVALRLPSVVTVESLREEDVSQGNQRARTFWSYLDSRDAARCFRLAVEANELGAEVFYACAADTTASLPTSEMIQKHYPGVEVREPLDGFAGAVSIAKARDRLGFEPQRSWRDS